MSTRLAVLPALLLMCCAVHAAASNAADVRFIGTVPHGMLELVGITDHPPTERSRWWRPDGVAAAIGPFMPAKRQPEPSLDWPNMPAYAGLHKRSLAFLVRFEPSEKAAPQADWSWAACWDIRPAPLAAYQPISGSPQWDISAVVDAHGKVVPNYVLLSALTEIGATAQEISVRAGISRGGWTTVASHTANADGARHFDLGGRHFTVTFKKAVAADVTNATQAGIVTTLTIRESYGKWARRLVAVDDHEREHAGPMIWRQNHWHASEQNAEAVFRDLPLTIAKEFRFQVRPFRWVEFKNVALQPGQTTDVKVLPLPRESPHEF